MNIQRTFLFKLKGNTYEVKSPTPRQLLKIESAKALITSGTYSEIMSMGTIGGNYALDIADLYSHLTVLVPDCIKDIKLSSPNDFLDMDLADFNELMTAYKEQFVPWANSWMELVTARPKPMLESENEDK